jgi:hypothetical protein
MKQGYVIPPLRPKPAIHESTHRREVVNVEADGATWRTTSVSHLRVDTELELVFSGSSSRELVAPAPVPRGSKPAAKRRPAGDGPALPKRRGKG